VKVGKLNRFLHQPPGQFGHSATKFHRDSVPRPALGTINVIFTKPGNNGSSGVGVMSVNRGCDLEAGDWAPKRARLVVTPTLGFSREDKEGTI